MKSIKECLNKSIKLESRYNQLKNLINHEINFIKWKYKKLKTPWKIFLVFEIIIFIFWIFSFIKWTINIIQNSIFYFEWYTYLSNCNKTLFRLDNRAKCKEYSETKLWKYFIWEKEGIDEESVVKKTIGPKIQFNDVLKLSPKYEENKFRIKENDQELDMRSFSYLDDSLKQSTLDEKRMMIDWYFKIHTIWNSLDEKTIIFTMHPYCYWKWYDWSFTCPWLENFDIPITQKLIYCENWKVLDDIFDNC
jgi:hypothetical protein